MRNDVYVGYIQNGDLDVKILVLAGDPAQAQAKAVDRFSASLQSRFHASDVRVALFSACA
jgi:hypothetical protein